MRGGDIVARWSNDEIEYLKNNYNKKTINEIASDLNRTRASIACKINDLSLVEEPDNGNYRIFKTIDSEISAYWLGFIYADGWIYNNNDVKCYELGIELKSIDINHLYKFNSIFNNYYKIKTRKRSTNSIDILNGGEPTNRINETALIRVYGKDIVNDLTSNGIVQNKTNSHIFPKIENKKLFIHFLRGYIDGDGSYVIDKKNRYKILIQGNNKQCFEYIKEKLYNDFNIHSYITKDRNCWKFCISRKLEVLKLINLMFNDATVYLDRKYNKITEIKEDAVLHGKHVE